MILETASDLNTVIRPLTENCLIRETFKMFSVIGLFAEVLFLVKYFLARKTNCKDFYGLLFRWAHFIPQSFASTPLRTPITTVSHFALLGVIPEN